MRALAVVLSLLLAMPALAQHQSPTANKERGGSKNTPNTSMGGGSGHVAGNKLDGVKDNKKANPAPGQ